MVELGFSSTLLLGRDVGPQERFLLALLVCMAACSFLYAIGFVHSKRLARIPIRIHVAGTRGKSSTVRLIAAGFRAGGHRVFAKVTGTKPHLLLPDGTEQLVSRWGPPAIHEQRQFIATAHAGGADVVVVEAMAFQAEYLRALEQFYVRATDVVITNVRPDHLEQLGLAPNASALALAECVPSGGCLVLTEESAIPEILDRAAFCKTEVSVVAAEGRDLDPEHTNRLLAVNVCRRYGISAEIAVGAMEGVRPDIGNFTMRAHFINGKAVTFANAFACNDTTSFQELWRRHQPPGRKAAFLLNHRIDRPLRTLAFLQVLARLSPDAPLFIIARNPMLRGRAVAAGFARERVHLVSPRSAAANLERLVADLPAETILWGVGNFHGPGAQISALLERQQSSC